MSSDARSYAENQLGVHTVYKEAQTANGELVGLHSSLLQAREERRRMTEEIADQEVIIWTKLRNAHPELSATALDAKAKQARRTDELLQDLRRGLQDAQSKEDTFEKSIKHCQNRIDIATARMIELGGYLPYLAKVWELNAVAPTDGSEKA